MHLISTHHPHEVHSKPATPALQIRSVNIFAYQMRSHPGCQLFFNNALPPGAYGSLSSTPPRCPLLIWQHFQHKSDDWSLVMWVVVGRKGVWRGDGGSCFDLSEICALTKTTEISMLALPPTRPTLALARQLNPSFCVPHSCMDLSAMGQGQWGIDRVMITKQVFPVRREGQLTEAMKGISFIKQAIFVIFHQ